MNDECASPRPLPAAEAHMRANPELASSGFPAGQDGPLGRDVLNKGRSPICAAQMMCRGRHYYPTPALKKNSCPLVRPLLAIFNPRVVHVT